MREHPNECVVINEKDWFYLDKPHSNTVGRQDYKDNFYFIDGNFYFDPAILMHPKSHLSWGFYLQQVS